MLLTRIFCHFKAWSKCIGMSFFVSDPWTTELYEMNEKWFWWCNLCFHMILWCFNPIDTIHIFLWEKIALFGCGVMARLWIQTTGFGDCLWQCLNDSSGLLSYTKRHRITIENLFLDGSVHILFAENKSMSKLHCQRWKCLLPSILKLLEDFFCMKAELFKTKFNLMSLSFYLNYHRIISLPQPLPFESVFLRVCAFETQLWEN